MKIIIEIIKTVAQIKIPPILGVLISLIAWNFVKIGVFSPPIVSSLGFFFQHLYLYKNFIKKGVPAMEMKKANTNKLKTFIIKKALVKYILTFFPFLYRRLPLLK